MWDDDGGNVLFDATFLSDVVHPPVPFINGVLFLNGCDGDGGGGGSVVVVEVVVRCTVDG